MKLVGKNLDQVLDAVKCLKFYYGIDNVLLGESKNESINSIDISFSENIKLKSGGEDPKSNLVNEINYILEQEMKTVYLTK
jgi:hypothetical protein